MFEKKALRKRLELGAVLKSSFLAQDCIEADEGHLTLAQDLALQRCRRPARQTEHTHTRIQLEKKSHSRFCCVQFLSSYSGQPRIKLTQEHWGNTAKIHPTLHIYEIILIQTTDLKSLALNVEFPRVLYIKGELCC